MPAAPLNAVFLASAEETEQQFYEALAHADVNAIMACWADEEEVSCIHPGSPLLVGLEAIRASFEAIFNHGPIDVHPEKTRSWHSEGVAVHSVLERVQANTDQGLQTAWVMSTNVYVKTAMGWRMVAHHGSPGGLEPEEVHETTAVLH
jgi:ketosteroid isomerase-like protein